MRKSELAKLTMPEFQPNINRDYVWDTMGKVSFLDIETSMIRAYIFGTGMQRIGIDDIVSGDRTRLLTAAWGSWQDLYQYGADGVYCASNHHSKRTFKKDPLDDTYVLAQLWHVLDSSDVIVAHNATFDRGWIEGRFMQLGWKQPSKYYVYCTYQNLHGLKSNSKKLDYLSRTLVGTKKVKHEGKELWQGCNEGSAECFEKMLAYNIGDIYETLYKVYMRTALYVDRSKCIDLGGEGLYCTVTGDELVALDEPHKNRKTGLLYTRYKNEKYNLVYRDRYNVRSKKAGLGYITPLVSDGTLYGGAHK